MATDEGLRFPENVIEANNIYHILLTLLQGELWYMYQVQGPQNYGEILIDKSWSYEIVLDNLDFHRTRFRSLPNPLLPDQHSSGFYSV